MFNINIFSKYKVIKHVDSAYKSYDSDDPDWFTQDSFDNEFELSGKELIEHLIKLLNADDFCDVELTVSSAIEMDITIHQFDPNNGTGTDYIYTIECINDYDNDRLFI